ncbi:MAG: DEAD/DEAH box helicase family protein, partial [Bacteroidota bacterium]
MSDFNPILNNPYEEPRAYYETDLDGRLDYERKKKGRRPFVPVVAPIPLKQGDQKQIFGVSDIAGVYEKHIVNVIRKEVGLWRETSYPETTRVTKELLTYWFLNSERTNRLFFAQREAIETVIWLNEVAEKSNPGQHILNELRIGQTVSPAKPEFNLPRVAFKMATGTGKTVVMAMQLLYHYFNRQEYRGDTRFADYFLIITPGITIKDRLGVLYVDTETTDKSKIRDYYRVRDLVPRKQTYQDQLPGINSRLIITNRHSFELRTLQGNKKSPFDGKKGRGKKEATEDFNLLVKRELGKFK